MQPCQNRPHTDGTIALTRKLDEVVLAQQMLETALAEIKSLQQNMQAPRTTGSRPPAGVIHPHSARPKNSLRDVAGSRQFGLRGPPAQRPRDPRRHHDYIRALNFPENSEDSRGLCRASARSQRPQFSSARTILAGYTDTAEPRRYLYGRPAPRHGPPRGMASLCRRRTRSHNRRFGRCSRPRGPCKSHFETETRSNFSRFGTSFSAPFSIRTS